MPLCPGRSPSLPPLPPPTSGETSPNPQGEEDQVLCGGTGARAVTLQTWDRPSAFLLTSGASVPIQTLSGQQGDGAPECPLRVAHFSLGRLFAAFCSSFWSLNHLTWFSGLSPVPLISSSPPATPEHWATRSPGFWRWPVLMGPLPFLLP